MAVPITALAIALRTELSTQLEVEVERRYAPYFDQSQLVEPKWILIATGDETTRQRRGIDDGELTVQVALQQALPDVEESGDDFLEQTEWLDARVADVDRLKALYRAPSGPLRQLTIAGCEFRRLKNIPLYRPELLIENGIFTSVVELVYVIDHDDDAEED